MFYGDSETGRTLPKDFLFLKKQWTLNNISMFFPLPNDISSPAQQFFFPTEHGLNQALLSPSVSWAFLPELLWGYYIQDQELILQLLKLHPLIPVCCSRRLQDQTTMERFLYTDSLPQHLCPPIGSQVATTKGASGLTTTALWTGSLSDVQYLFGFSRPVRHPSLPSDPTHKLTRWQLTGSFYNLSVQDVWIWKIWILQMTSHFLRHIKLSSLCMSFQKAADEGMTAWCQGHKKW